MILQKDIGQALHNNIGQVGKTISHYKILEKIGEGGMGVIYKAEDTKLKRSVALKFLTSRVVGSKEEKNRFIREAQAAAALSHSNICTVYEIGESEDPDTLDKQSFIVMEYIEGQSLKEKVDSGLLKSDEAVDISRQIAMGLQEAHEKGIVHRDVKSANIMITEKGQAKIMDFGLAKVPGRTQITKTGTTVGTAAYMSPEQAKGDVVDHRSDIWSLGVVLYEMMTGQLPFKGEYEQAVVYSILNEDPEPFPKLPGKVSPQFETIIYKCLQKIPENRYQSVSELRIDITRVIAGKTPKRATIHRRITPGKLIRLRSNLRASGLLVILILVLFLLWFIPSNWREVRIWLGLISLPAEKHLVVLPFTIIGEDPMNQAFSDGLMKTLTEKLIQLEQFQESFWIVPTRDVLKREITNVREAYREFGINLALTGELQLSSDSFRLYLTLIDTKTLKELGLAVIENRMTNVSLLQDESVFKITEMLDIKLSPESHRILSTGGTTVSSAYNFFLLGHGYLQQFEKIVNLVTAISFFNRAIKQDSLYALAHASLGQAYWYRYEASKDTQWVKEALSNCERAVELNDLLASTHETLGLIYIESGRYEEGMKEFQRTLELNPFSTATYDRLAKVYEAQGRIEKTESTYQKAIQMKPDYWAGYKYLGLFYFRNGRYDDAVKQFHQVLMLTPDDYTAYNNLGAMHYYVERYEDARQMWERSITIEPSWEAVSNLGALYRLERRYSESARVYEGVLDLYNDYYALWGNLATAYYWAPGERQKAFDTYQRAINMAEEQRRLTPQQSGLLADLAGYYSMIGDRSETISLVKQALVIAPKNVEVMYRAGHAYEQLGERQKALEWIKKALDNGYPRADIESEPGLSELREDERFQRILQNQSVDK